MPHVVRSLIFLLLVGAAHPSAAQEDPCLLALDALHAVPAQLTSSVPYEDCATYYTEALTLNAVAVANAVRVENVEDLYGTWLGDDVRLTVFGIVAPGQEVLRIEPGPAAQSIRIRQYWYSAYLPRPNWNDQGEYTGLVTEAIYRIDDPFRGGFSNANGIDFVRHTPISLSFFRSADLYLKFMLDRFSGSGSLRLDDDALVMESRRIPSSPLDLDTERFVTMTGTFHRVADHAPDLSILLAGHNPDGRVGLIDCLAHQISQGFGPLFDALSPIQPDRQLLERHLVLEIAEDEVRDFMEAFALALSMGENDAEDVDADYAALYARLEAARADPDIVHVLGALRDNEFGCPALTTPLFPHE